MAENYFNQLPFRRQLAQLQQCRFMQANEFEAGCQELTTGLPGASQGAQEVPKTPSGGSQDPPKAPKRLPRPPSGG